MKKSLTDNIDTLFTNCRLATMSGGSTGIIENAAIAISGENISFVGPENKLPKNIKFKLAPPQIIDCSSRWILPGFVDCHTHLVWAGSRVKEYQKRLQGISYQDILRHGGGILSTVSETRNVSHEKLYHLSKTRLETLISHGITSVEIKSGYGLDLENELKILEVIKELSNSYPVHIEPTFLGAHALPEEFKNKPDKYVELITRTMLPEVKKHNLANAVDVFCENIGFSLKHTKTIFKAAGELGFQVKLHAEQLSDSKGTQLACEFNALSCDHLEYLSSDGAEKMAETDVTAVLLPGAFYYLNETQRPPVKTLRNLKVPMALATDLNPGSSPVFSMSSVMNLACNLFGMTCEEALLGATINGARALKIEDRKGSIEKGKDADLAIWDINDPIELCYFADGLRPEKIMIQGKFFNPSSI